MFRPKRPKPIFIEAKPSLFERFFRLRDAAPGIRQPRWSRVLRGIFLPVILIAALGRAILNALSGLLSWIWHALTASGSRQWRHLLEGLPALLATVAVLVIGGIVLGRESRLHDIYQQAAADAFAEKEYEKAYLYFERLFKLDNGTAETRLYLGLALDQLGRSTEAMRLITGVAEGDAGGDPRANAWVAAKLLEDEELRNDPGVRAVIYRNLLQADQGLPNSLQVQLNLANYHLISGDFRKAIPYLEQAAKISPVVNIELARFYSLDGRINSAKTALERAEQYLQTELERHPVDQKTRLLLAKTTTMLGKFGIALEVLEQGLALNPSGPYPPMISATHVAIYDQLAAEPDRNYSQMLHHLREALRYRPGMTDAIKRLVGFGETTNDSPIQLTTGNAGSIAKQDAKELLRELLVQGVQAPSVHMALGLKAWRDNDFESARMHFEAAYDLDPTIVEIANNLAWILTHQKLPQPKRALSVINSVIERHPNVRRFRDTRGEVYLALERWDEAIRDLEFALPALKENPRIHLSLAKAYDARGQRELAEEHREEARRLQQAATASRPTDKSPTSEK